VAFATEVFPTEVFPTEVFPTEAFPIEAFAAEGEGAFGAPAPWAASASSAPILSAQGPVFGWPLAQAQVETVEAPRVPTESLSVCDKMSLRRALLN
jgi:hypothetical protein